MGKFIPTPLTEELVARAEAKHGRVLRFKLPLRSDLTLDVMARPFTTESWDAYYDAQFDAPDDAVINMFSRHILWPCGAELDKLVNAFGVFPGAVLVAMRKAAGGTGAVFDRLDESLPESVLADAGLPAEEAQRLINKAGGLVTLELVKLKVGGSLVIRAPGYTDLSRMQRALSKRVGVAAAFRQATIDGTAWSSQPIGDLLIAAPAAPALVAHALLRLGGADAEAQFLGGADAPPGAAV